MQPLGFGLFGRDAIRFGQGLGMCRLDERNARLRQCIAQGRHLLGQRAEHRHPLRRGLQCRGGGTNGIRHRTNRCDTVPVRLGLRGNQTTDVPFGWGSELGHRRHFGHREGAIERVDRACQSIRGMRLAGPCLRQPRIDGLEVATDFRTQDFEQHGIDGSGNRFDLGTRMRHFGNIGRGSFDFRLDSRLHCGRRSGRNGLQQHIFARRQAISDGFERWNVDIEAGLAAQGRVQAWQDALHLSDIGHHGITCRARAVEHAIEHALDVPAELAEHLRADQPTAALEGMEHAADRAQRLAILRCQPPRRQQLFEIAEFFLEFLEKDFADLVVDFFARGDEAGIDGGTGRCHCNHGCCFDGSRRLGRCLCRFDRRSRRQFRGIDRLARHFRRRFGLRNRFRSGCRRLFRDRPIVQGFEAGACLAEQVGAGVVRIAQ